MGYLRDLGSFQGSQGNRGGFVSSTGTLDAWDRYSASAELRLRHNSERMRNRLGGSLLE